MRLLVVRRHGVADLLEPRRQLGPALERVDADNLGLLDLASGQNVGDRDAIAHDEPPRRDPVPLQLIQIGVHQLAVLLDALTHRALIAPGLFRILLLDDKGVEQLGAVVRLPLQVLVDLRPQLGVPRVPVLRDELLADQILEDRHAAGQLEAVVDDARDLLEAGYVLLVAIGQVFT